jgi:hypothetical protein
LTGCQILQGKTKGIKLDRTLIIANKTASTNEVLDNMWRDKDVMKVEGARGELGSTGSNYRETRAIANYDMLRIEA